MSRGDWAELNRLFDEICPLEKDEQTARLERIRADSPSLADRLAGMLEHSADAESSISGIVDSAIGGLDQDIESTVIGQRFGAYRVVSHLARGGMGDVFLAERDDGAFEQRVAIKLIGRGLLARDAEARFGVERQILAKLDHPNIARILDGGTTADNVAYLVMEYVDGQPIDDYCRGQGLSIRRRLELYRQVCSAIEYAHRNLIVHRDVKPSNILVTSGGVPKLLDFGIAKLLGDDEGVLAAEATQATSRVMTPDFASPEQILGQPITTASDVYALGVLLYGLLAESKPYSTSGLRPSELEKVVVDTLPVKPSQAVLGRRRVAARLSPHDAASWSRRIRGDLDDIVLKALRKEPEQRYGSAQELSADVRRHLTGRPVEARGITWLYVLRKFMQRNLLPVAAASVVAAGGLIAAVYHNHSITQERDRVRAEAEKAAASSQFLVDIFKLSDPDETQGATVTAKEILDIGARRLEQDLLDQPATRAMLGTTIGTVYENLGLYEEARRQLQEAVRLREGLGDSLGLAESLRELGGVQYEMGELDESRRSYERALETNEAVLPNDHVENAVLLNDLGHVIYAQGDYDTALGIYERAVSMFERLEETSHFGYPDTLHDVGQIKQLQGELAVAERYISRALDFALERYGEKNSVTVAYMSNLAVLLQEMDQYEEAERLYLKVLDLELELLGEDHPDREATMTNIGRLYGDMNRLDEAELYLRQATEHAARTLGLRHTFTAYDMINLANLLQVKGENVEAQRLYEAALGIYADNLDENHPYIASASVGYAALLNQIGEPLTADIHTQRALDICQVALPPGHWLAASANSVRGESLMIRGELDAAEPLLLDAYAVVAEARPRDRITTNALKRLVRYYELRGNDAEAARYRTLIAEATRPTL